MEANYVKFNKANQGRYPQINEIRQYWRGLNHDNSLKSIKLDKEMQRE